MRDTPLTPSARRIALAVTLALCAACAPQTDPQPSSSPAAATPTSPSPSSPATPAPSTHETFPPTPAHESPDQAALRAAWTNYWTLYYKFAANPNLIDDPTHADQLYTVATGQGYQFLRDEIRRLQERKLTATGDLLTDLVINEPTSSPDGRTATLTFCWDLRNQTLLDQDGQPYSPSNLPPVLLQEWTMLEGADNAWRLFNLTSKEAATC